LLSDDKKMGVRYGVHLDQIAGNKIIIVSDDYPRANQSQITEPLLLSKRGHGDRHRATNFTGMCMRSSIEKREE
jgi:hypothetical protein